MTDDELQRLRDEADQLIAEVEKKLDNSDFVFDDGSGEETESHLRDCAKRCSAAGLNNASRRLEQLAEDVAERTEQ